MPCPPVLILAFNRPANVRRVIDALRLVKPKQLFFAVDGERPSHPDDASNCRAVRALTTEIDWPCEVKTFFRESNRGCKYAPPEAITWFFSHVEAGVILEDDCVPTPDFLHFADEMLERYRLAPNVGVIGGNNCHGFQSDKSASYFFSRYAPIWGWATWRRAWSAYDVDMAPYVKRLDEIHNRLGHSRRFRKHWWKYVDYVRKGGNTWDVQWWMALFANNLLAVCPKCNLVANIGFAAESTHTSFEYGSERYSKTGRLDFPLTHPQAIQEDADADRKFEKHYISLWRRGMTFIGARSGRTGRNVAEAVFKIESLFCRIIKLLT